MKKFDFNKSALDYDNYYKTEFGRKVDEIEKNCVKKYLDLIPKGDALEIGCGTGHWTNFFTLHGFSVTAIDIADKMLEIAKNKNIPNARFILADALNLPFPDNNFNIIFAVTSLEFTENQKKSFDEIFRVLKPNGYLLIGGLLDSSELAKNRDNSETFKNADFFSFQSMKNFLSKFGKPQISTCLKIKNNTIIETEESNSEFDTFIVGFVKKE